MTVAAPAFTVGILPQEPARANRTFYGWNTQANGSGKKFTEATAVTADITVYAQWQKYPENSLFVTSKEDDGKGSLRQAIKDAPAGGTIVIDRGLTIFLANNLIIDKSLTILGNGSIITCGENFTKIDLTSQLIYIPPNKATEAHISRLRFVDGRADNYGAAIRNQGILTVDSCIFSGNKTNDSPAQGGAIYNNKTMNLRGCTFYNNTSGYYGGAVYNAGDLTLEGNLFYGNASLKNSYGSVVYNVKNATSKGYNVADNQLVANDTNAQSGWKGHSTDMTFSDLGISGSPFINTDSLMPAATLRNCIPSPPSEDFPKTDFNGELRTWPGTPGAVN
jgi:uncharacterized repeat protein (TIGR02543 family)